ncbi:MAG: glycoside hydrolase family 3 C-terminal domain-containing protein [Oscillospiraceae bacterium]|nr:glycoside hydrolase family 3 C-terminal domain-containing protein [Oscillospiraceae bacterium]
MEKNYRKPLSFIMSAVMVLTTFGVFNLIAPEPAIKAAALPYQDTTLSFEERAADLVSRMTIQEKEKQLGNSTPAISRLGISEYHYWKEALHGVANMTHDDQNATSFPYSLSMAASWDRELVREIASAISDEARGFSLHPTWNWGLNFFSPTINMARDPRWGRNHESYGEDTFLTSQIGLGFVTGFQSDTGKFIKASTTIKHYALNNSEYNRHRGTMNADDRDLREYFTRAFKGVVLGTNVGSVMTGYNRVNEVPASANRYILDDLLRKSWGFRGFMVSDCGAINNMYETFNHYWKPLPEHNKQTAVKVGQRYVDADGYITPQGATALSIMAGTDMDCGAVYPNNAVAAVNNGLMSEDDMDIALVRIFVSRFRTGEFDKAEDPYRTPEYSYANQVASKKHKQLAEDSADQGIVMIKNEKAKPTDTKPVLPLDKTAQRNIVLVGPSNIATNYTLGAYSGRPFPEDITTPRQGLANVLGLPGQNSVSYISGGSYSDSIAGQTRNVTIRNGSTVLQALTPKDAFRIKDVVFENSDGGRFGYVMANCEMWYHDVDLTGANAITIEMNNVKAGCTAEFWIHAPHGNMMIATAPLVQGGSYPVSVATIGSTGGYNVGDLQVILRGPAQAVTLTENEKNTIRNADAVIVAIGSEGGDSNEGRDRSTIAFPRLQGQLARDVCALNPNNVVYIQSVGALEIGEFIDEANAIIWCAYNGQAQGNAMARVIFGDAQPTGKLPFTWYADDRQLPTLDEYHIRQDAFAGKTHNGWTYQYFNGDISYPFGHGLTYSSFAYSNMTVDKTAVTPDDTVSVTVDVKNTGAIDSAEVVQLYVVPPLHDQITRPAKQLKGFDKIQLTAGETKTVTIQVDMADMYFWDEALQKNIHDPGEYIFQIGASSADIKFEKTLSLTGTLTDKLQTVTANPDKVVIYANRPGSVADAGIVVSLRDDSWLDLRRADVAVTYTSKDPAVATVDKNGIVTPAGTGVTLITAKVTLKGESMTASFPVVVLDGEDVSLSAIRADGKLLAGFSAKRLSYDYCVPAEQTTLPTFTASAPAGIEVTVTPAASIPGTVTITAKKGTTTVRYSIFLGYPPSPDDFTDGPLGSQWKIVRPNTSNYSLDATGLRITAQGGDIQNQNNQNLVLQPGTGNWRVSTDFTIDSAINGNWQQMGIVVCEGSGTNDPKAFVKFMIEHDGKQTIMIRGRRDSSNTDTRSTDLTLAVGSRVHMELEREGDTYTAYYAIGGGELTLLGSIPFVMSNIHVGVCAFTSGAASFNCTFKNFGVKLPPPDGDEAGELTDIKLGGQSLAGFSPDLTAYTVTLADGAAIPNVTATYAGSALLEIDQAAAAPGTANVAIGSGGVWKDYKIRFVYEKKHKVTYQSNGGNGPTVESELLGYNDSYYTIFNPFASMEYSFDGWNTEPDGSGTAYAANAKITVSGSITLYAQWKIGGSSLLPGNPSGSGKVSVTDARLVLQYLVGKITLTPEALAAAAVNGEVNDDGSPKVTITDARLILQKLVDKIDKFPVEKMT